MPRPICRQRWWRDPTAASARRRWLAEIRSEDRLAGILIMRIARLDLLRDRVHVAKAPLERIAGEHGGRAGHVIGGIDHGCRLMDGPGRGDANRDPVRF